MDCGTDLSLLLIFLECSFGMTSPFLLKIITEPGMRLVSFLAAEDGVSLEAKEQNGEVNDRRNAFA